MLALVEWLKENGYNDCLCISPTIISLFHERIGSRVFLHIDEQFLVLEQPHELGSIDQRPRESFELWVDLNDPNSLPTMLDFLSRITSWGVLLKKSAISGK